MSVSVSLRLAVALAPLCLCSCVVNSLKASQPAMTMRVRLDGALGQYHLRLSNPERTFRPDANGVFTLELPEVERRCIREVQFFGWTFGRDPVPQVDLVRSDSSRVRRRVAITALDRLREDADGVRVLE